jgi:trigger factor
LNVIVTDQEACKKELRLEIPADTVLAETEKVIRELSRRITLPGFRPGHVPKSVIKARFRKELRDEVASKILPDALGEAIKSNELKVIGSPTLQNINFGTDESIDATFTVEVRPEINLANYKNLPLRKRVYKVTDEEIDAAIQRLREDQAELVPVEERTARLGDRLTVNIKVQTIATEGSQSHVVEQQDVDADLTEDLDVDLKEALIGTRPGDRRTYTTTFSESHSNEKLAGRSAECVVEVTAVRTTELPELDEEFAQTIASELRSIDDLREYVANDLAKQRERVSDRELRVAALEALVDRNSFAIPENLVEEQINLRMRRMAREMAAAGVDLRELKLDWEALRDTHRARAEREVRGAFVLEKIGDVEAIEVGESEIDDEIEKMASESGQSTSALKARLTKEKALDSIKEQVRNRKALDIVLSSADVRIEEVEGLGGEGGQGEEGKVPVE